LKVFSKKVAKIFGAYCIFVLSLQSFPQGTASLQECKQWIFDNENCKALVINHLKKLQNFFTKKVRSLNKVHIFAPAFKTNSSCSEKIKQKRSLEDFHKI